jgi:pyridoxamine 5'-phosphate oxidase
MEQLPNKLPANPLALAQKWLKDAQDDGAIPNPDAMTLATVNESGAPSARIVLCKQLVTDPGYLIFYTNYDSAKAKDIEADGRVAGTFHWDHMNRQIRIEGIAVRSPTEESDTYFASRDKQSQIGAWSSAQSQPIESRQMLQDKQVTTVRKLAALSQESGKNEIPRPPFWGGYRIWIMAVELWVRGDARLHDRGRWERSLAPSAQNAFQTGEWQATRIQP